MPKVAGRVFERVTTNGRTQFKPIANARIVFLEVGNPTNTAWADSAANGSYSLELPAGNYDTVVGARGYTLHSNLGRPGHSVLRDTARVHTNNFFLEAEPEPDVIVQKQATIDAHIYLPDLDQNAGKRDIVTAITFNVTKGTMVVDDIPDFRNEDGLAFEASLTSENGRYTKANREASLTIDATIDPDARIFGQDVFLRDVSLSSQTTIGRFVGAPLNNVTKRLILVGKTRSDQAGRRNPLDDKPMHVRLVIDLDDVVGLV